MKRWKKAVLVMLCLLLAAGAGLLGINGWVKSSAAGRILAPEEAAELTGVDCVLVLGCYVRPDGTPSDMLADRLRRGISLYEQGAAPKLLMSGDHGRVDYDEVNAMKDAAVAAGVPSADVFMDHAGFSTYESIYRAKEIFQAGRIIIVSQEYHLYRALYIAQQLGVEAWGVAADYHTYRGQIVRDARELLARVKDAAVTLYRPEPTYLGKAIPVSGDGDITNDRQKEGETCST